jgi:hypothetical protein
MTTLSWNVVPLEHTEHLARAANIIALCPTYPSDRNGNRSVTPAFHFGIWSLYSPLPSITYDTRRHPLQICCAINRFLKAIAKYLAPHILMLLRFYAPDVYERQMKLAYSIHIPSDD